MGLQVLQYYTYCIYFFNILSTKLVFCMDLWRVQLSGKTFSRPLSHRETNDMVYRKILAKMSLFQFLMTRVYLLLIEAIFKFALYRITVFKKTNFITKMQNFCGLRSITVIQHI